MTTFFYDQFIRHQITAEEYDPEKREYAGAKNAYTILMFAWSLYAAAAGAPAFAALFWTKAAKSGIIASIMSGFVECVEWKLIGTPFGLGPTVP